MRTSKCVMTSRMIPLPNKLAIGLVYTIPDYKARNSQLCYTVFQDASTALIHPVYWLTNLSHSNLIHGFDTIIIGCIGGSPGPMVCLPYQQFLIGIILCKVVPIYRTMR